MLTLYAVVPCYNEEAALPDSAEKLQEKWWNLMAAGRITPNSRITLVDDGSTDSTWSIIQTLCAGENSLFCAVKLSRNRGHQAALLAGLQASMNACDACVSLDADLQGIRSRVRHRLRRAGGPVLGFFRQALHGAKLLQGPARLGRRRDLRPRGLPPHVPPGAPRLEPL